MIVPGQARPFPPVPMGESRLVQESWQFALQIIHGVITIAIAIYAYASDRQRAHRDQLDAVRKDHEDRIEKKGAEIARLREDVDKDLDALRAEHDARLRASESGLAQTRERLTHLPASTEVAELVARVREMQAELRATITPVSARLERIEDYLHNRSLHP